MDIQTKDGILLRGIPEGTPDDAIKERIAKIRAERPATMNMSIAAQGEKARENMSAPDSVTDPKYPAYKKAQDQAEMVDVLSGILGMGAGAILKPGASLMRSGAKSLMQSALKPSVSEGAKNVDRVVQTMLDEGINVSRGGVEKLRNIGTGLNDEVQNILNASNATVRKGAPAMRIQDEIAAVDRNNPLPNAPRAALEGVHDEYMSNPLIAGQIPLADAQRYKQSLYQGLKDDYGTLSTGETAGRKALARGFREGIERGAPEVIPLNSRASDVWNALNMAERRALVSGNKDPLGLASLAGNPVGAGSFLLNRSEEAKSLIARALYNSQRVPGAAVGAVTPSIVEALLKNRNEGNEP